MKHQLLGYTYLLVGVALMTACGNLLVREIGGGSGTLWIVMGFAVGLALIGQLPTWFVRKQLADLELKLAALTQGGNDNP